jgi:hypothetical protein
MTNVINFLKSVSSPNLAAIRHGLTVLFTLLGTIGIMSVAGTPKLMDQIINLIQAFGVLAGALATFLGVIGPIIMGWYANYSAQDEQQIKRVEAIALDPSKPTSVEAKVAILDAAASLPEIAKPIKVTSPILAKKTTSPLVQA